MKLSLKMLAEKLEKHVTILKFKDIYSTLRLSRPIFLTNETELLKNTLYITSADRLPENLTFQEGCGLIISGTEKVDTLSIPAVILTDNKIDIFSLYNYISGIFDFFNSWHNQLEHISTHYGRFMAFEKFLSVSSKLFENMLAISDSSYHYITTTNPEISETSPASSYSFDKLSTEVIALLKQNPVYRMLDREKEIFVASDPQYPHRVMIRNIFDGSTVMYRITVSETCRPFRETDYLFLEFLATFIEKSLRRDFDVPISDTSSLQGILYNAMVSGSWAKESLEKEFNKVNWKIDDPYIAINLSFKNQSLILDSIKYYFSDITRGVSGAVAFNYHSNIILILNLNHYKTENINNAAGEDPSASNADLKEIEQFLADNSLTAGVSNVFTDIYDLKKHFRQAEAALELGSSIHPAGTMYKFSDYALAYIFKAATAEFSPKDLLSPIYTRLAEHDRDNNTEYLKTLKEYLVQNMNAVQTASSLFIHRATLIYRMKRISEIGQTELKDPAELLHIALSFGLENNILSSTDKNIK